MNLPRIEAPTPGGGRCGSDHQASTIRMSQLTLGRDHRNEPTCLARDMIWSHLGAGYGLAAL